MNRNKRNFFTVLHSFYKCYTISMKISDVVRFRLVLHFQLSSWWLCKRATLRQDGWSSRRETCATWWGAQRNLMCLTSLVSSAKTELCDHDGLSVILSVCLSVCMQDYYKSKQPISLKLGVIIQTTNQKNWLTFPGYGFRITFPLPNHCGDSRRFTRISHTVSGRFSRHFAKWLMPTR